VIFLILIFVIYVLFNINKDILHYSTKIFLYCNKEIEYDNEEIVIIPWYNSINDRDNILHIKTDNKSLLFIFIILLFN